LATRDGLIVHALAVTRVGKVFALGIPGSQSFLSNPLCHYFEGRVKCYGEPRLHRNQRRTRLDRIYQKIVDLSDLCVLLCAPLFRAVLTDFAQELPQGARSESKLFFLRGFVRVVPTKPVPRLFLSSQLRLRKLARPWAREH